MVYKKLNVQVIGICGKARAGKDSIASYLDSKYSFSRFGFAQQLKEMAMREFNLSYDQLYGNEKEVTIPGIHKSPRYILQSMGTWYRTIDPDFWINKLYDRLHMPYKPKGICISDVRFKNEVNFIREIGGTIYRVVRPGTENMISTPNHISETELDEFEFPTIANNGTIEELHAEIDRIVKVKK